MADASQHERQSRADQEQLQLLTIGYYVVGGLIFLFSCFALIYVAIGVIIAISPPNPNRGEPPPQFVGIFFAAVGTFFLLLGWFTAALTVFVGRSIQKRRRRTFTLVMAAVECAFFPFGTVLGVCTFLVLLRESVMRIYDEEAQASQQFTDFSR
jgi:hypothetical protein